MYEYIHTILVANLSLDILFVDNLTHHILRVDIVYLWYVNDTPLHNNRLVKTDSLINHIFV